MSDAAWSDTPFAQTVEAAIKLGAAAAAWRREERRRAYWYQRRGMWRFQLERIGRTLGLRIGDPLTWGEHV